MMGGLEKERGRERGGGKEGGGKEGEGKEGEGKEGGEEGRKEKGWVYQVEMLSIAHTNTSIFGVRPYLQLGS